MIISCDTDANWYMDTGATSHLATDTHVYSLLLAVKVTLKSILVGNGSAIPITHTGQSKIITTHRPLHLHNVLVTPSIIKHLIYVCRFTTDNHVSIEFDPFGFTVKDLATLQVLLRCDSTSDLYPCHLLFKAPMWTKC